jgi:hypothetical protein
MKKNFTVRRGALDGIEMFLAQHRGLGPAQQERTQQRPQRLACMRVAVSFVGLAKRF